MLLALQATSSVRISHIALQTALGKVEECIRFGEEMGQTWLSGGRLAGTLRVLLQDKLRPIVERRLAQKTNQPPTMVVDVGSGGSAETETSDERGEPKYAPLTTPFVDQFPVAAPVQVQPHPPPQQQQS